MTKTGTSTSTVPKPKKKVHRSPKYPSITLGDAITKAQAIHEIEKRIPTTGDVILSHLGYKATTGPAARTLSALKQYGLLEELEGGMLRISEDAYKIIVLSEDNPQRQAALQAAARRPTLFEELLTRYKDGLPSDATLRSHLLLEKSFNPSTVAEVIRIFRATNQVAKLSGGSYTGIPERRADHPSGGEEDGMEAQQDDFSERGRVIVRDKIYNFSTQLSFPRNVKAEIRISGDDIRRSDIVRLKKIVDDLEEAWKDDANDGAKPD